MIPFNKPYLHGRELVYIVESVASGKISGDGIFTRKCHNYFESNYNFSKALLTTSCTDALEMAAILLNIQPGDEVITPSYTFVSTVNAFVLRGARIVFADSYPDHPNVDPKQIAKLITPRTRAIVVVHYAGVACDMDAIMSLAEQYNIPVVEDAAQAIDAFYKSRPLGSIGCLSTFSFHETKNIISGEGGLLVINDPQYVPRAEIIREKGTNRSSFFRGEVDKYGWVDIGSSFLPSDIIAAYLYAQLEQLEAIQRRRLEIWHCYLQALTPVVGAYGIKLPSIPDYATNNAHMFYLDCASLQQRSQLIKHLDLAGIKAVFHYQSLHCSPYFQGLHDGRSLPNADHFTDSIVRLPMYFDLSNDEVDFICEQVVTCLRQNG
ncbi:dTDP-4-amino-4,6-dideoxygalactose transaminase [Aeromonas salmonicida]|uniref:dTDP-4-amino-4,6-dideoxygalactose transaminase n=1 Tax=Aeromonas salmonicida TaxID=645 RepID=UPI00073BAEDF|nr:dTDP-4-amino-4,6-dideoxygalactose transaminase [Aeromonas salmonicida]KTA83523.1 TDP-4-oxo-6-deoxy-D-glucose aminotransferase [Aeromonas salmonicida]MDE7526651.1 dTDP-4-amino-4,6-dideoxygalactose transaminase [Aeromonas salmonicida]MDE7530955.1 dTDP-4-amino-4,6-dideoxygalactose transaminase [Aeromonas salmonicida]